MIEVLLVDDHAVVRAGYRRMLEAMPDISVVEAEDCESSLSQVKKRRFDVYVLDLTLPGVSGLETMRRILAIHEDARILIFSMHADVVFATRALQVGARGYLSKSSSPEVMVEAARALLGEEKVVESPMVMGAEDFSYMAQQAPGCFLNLGVRHPSWDAIYPVHRADFRLDEDALPIGAAALAAAAIRWMETKR